MMKKFFICSIILFLCSPLFLSAGLKMLSSFDSIYDEYWKTELEEGAGKGKNYIRTSDKFQGSGCIEFKVDNIGDNWNNKCLWQWICPTAENWSNYGKFVFATKVKSIYQYNAGASWERANYSLNFGIAIKEPWGDPGWKGEVWNYYMTNSYFTYDTNSWYLWEIDITKFKANDFNTRFNKFQDDSAGNDLDLNGNKYPPRGVREMDIFFKSGYLGVMNNQKVRFDFMGILSTPYPLVKKQTNYYPITLRWHDDGEYHPVYQLQMVTNSTNSAPLVNHIVKNAQSLSGYTYNAFNFNIKPRYKYKWHLRSGYILSSSRGFYSGSYKRYNINKLMTTVPANTSVTLWSYYSKWSEFTNTGIRPFQTSFFSPENNSADFAVNNMTFSWEDLRQEGAEIYRITISSDQNFTRIITTRRITDNSFILSNIQNCFTMSSNYYYAVEAGYTNYRGIEIWDLANTNSFTYYYADPQLLSPEDQGEITDDQALFRWANAFDGVNYRLQISSNSSFSKIIDTASGQKLSSQNISFTLDKYYNESTYFWRVMANCSFGTRYSPVRSFFLDLDSVYDIEKITIYPTIVSSSEPFNIKLIADNNKELDKVKILYFNPFNQLVAEQDLLPSQFSQGKFSSIPSELGLNKGYHFIYMINYYKDQTTERSKVMPLVIK